MTRLNTGRVGLITAMVFSGWHLLWALLVATGTAQVLLDFIFWAHMLQPVFFVEQFDIVKAATLVLVTGALGFVTGAVSAGLWNALHRE